MRLATEPELGVDQQDDNKAVIQVEDQERVAENPPAFKRPRRSEKWTMGQVACASRTAKPQNNKSRLLRQLRLKVRRPSVAKRPLPRAAYRCYDKLTTEPSKDEEGKD